MVHGALLAMSALTNSRGKALEDSLGQQSPVGATAVDDIFGEGIARGTVPLERGDGVNVRIDWLGPGADGKPTSCGGGGASDAGIYCTM